MLRQLDWKLPLPYRKEEIQNTLSCDWQIYIACFRCGWEVRYEPAFGVPPDDILKNPCDKCGHTEKNIIRHLLKVELVCRECSNYFEKYVSNLYGQECPNCTSRKLGIISLYVVPAFPEKFGEEPFPKEKDWGESGDNDGDFIIQSLQVTNMHPDRELYFLPAIKFCERLRLFSNYPSEQDLGQIWNIEGLLLRDYFKHTNEFEAGIDAIEAYQKSIELTKEPIQKALVIHNLAMICYSLLVKLPQAKLTLYGASPNLKETGISKALEALAVFEHGPGANQPYSSQQTGRIQHLLGDLYKIDDPTQKDLELSIVYLDKALQTKDLPDRDKTFIAESKSIAISKMKDAPEELKKEIEPGFKKLSTRDEKDRAYSEKWLALLNLSMHYWDEGKYDKALISIEEAAAKAVYDLENAIDISTLELRSRQFAEVFNALFRSYVKFEKALEGIIALEQFRALILKFRIFYKNDEILRDNIAKKITRPLMQLLSGKVEHTVVKTLSLSKDEFIKNLRELTGELENEQVAFISLSAFNNVVSAILIIVSRFSVKTKTFQWRTEEQQIKIFSENLPGLMYASVFNEMRFSKLRKISSFFLLPEIYEEVKKAGVKKIGFSIQSIFNLYPYEALDLSQNGLQLVDEFDIFYYPSFEIIRNLSKLRSGAESKKLLIVPYLGNDLEYTKVELDRLRETLPHQTTVFEGGEYPKNKLIAMMEEDFDYIHFICHGTFDPLDPLESALILNAKSRDSGRLYSREILKINFKKAPVISLSACSSGLTSFDKFETYTGLTGSFLQAGAKGIISSRWEVPDIIGCEFMINFYKSIFLKGHSALESVRDAQLLLKDKVKGKDWACFSYLGTI